MGNRKLIIFIRYLSITMLLFSLLVVKRNNIDSYLVIFMMLYIINNQLRFFIFDKNRTVVFVSIILECVLSCICYENYGGILSFYFITTIIDGVFLLRAKMGYTACGIVFIGMSYLSRGLKLNWLTLNFSSLLIIGILAVYINKEYSEKVKAQNLYDRLRISEEKLKKANVELEIYANSIEELTILKERNRISREIHDSVGHSLSTIIIQLGAISKMTTKNPLEVSDIAMNLREFAKSSLNEVRLAVRELKPEEYEKYEGLLSIQELIKNFKKFTGVEVYLGLSGEKWRLNARQVSAIHRVIQEFLSNSIRHGMANKINIFMNFKEDILILTLKDNGRGAEKIEKGIGLTSITERIGELGGKVEYSTKVNEGFFMRVVISSEEEAAF